MADEIITRGGGSSGEPQPGDYPEQMPTTVYIMINGSTIVEKYDTTALNISISITSTGCSIVVGSSSYTWTYSGTATFAGLSTTNGATVPDSGFAVGDTYTTSIAAQGSYAPSFYSVDTVLPVQYITTDEELTSIADAIRSKGGTSAQLVYPTGFITAIGNISTGSGTVQSSKSYTVSDSGSATISPDTGYDTMAAVALTVPSGSAGTPTATKGSVSNHTISVTPSVTNTSGYITGSTKTGTAVFVSASELVSGNYAITSNGNNINVTDYATVSVNVTTSSAPEKKDVNFIDYDGTLLYSYNASEISALTALPPNPSHTGLIAQGWNWTLSELKAQINALPNNKVCVGQTYTTTSGNTEIDIELTDDMLNPKLSYGLNGSATINWGDNSFNNVSGSSTSSCTSLQHIYSSAGKYTITISVSSGSFSFYGASGYNLLLHTNTSSASPSYYQNYAYAYAVKAIRLGSNITLQGKAFYRCGIRYLIIPPNITFSEGCGEALGYCYDLKAIVIPHGITVLGNNVSSFCHGAPSLQWVSIPPTITSYTNNMFGNCPNLREALFLKDITFSSANSGYNKSIFASLRTETVELPSSLTRIPLNMFEYSWLRYITLPSELTNIEGYAFQSCERLKKIIIPKKVTDIGNYAFRYCYSMEEIHFKSTTPPTLGGTSVFYSLPTTCKIYVPTGYLSNYTSATNYPSSGTYTYIQE